MYEFLPSVLQICSWKYLMSAYALCHSVSSLSMQLPICAENLIVWSLHIKSRSTCDNHRKHHRILETRPRKDLSLTVWDIVLELNKTQFFLCRASKDLFNKPLRIVPWCVGDLDKVHTNIIVCACAFSLRHKTYKIHRPCQALNTFHYEMNNNSTSGHCYNFTWI